MSPNTSISAVTPNVVVLVVLVNSSDMIYIYIQKHTKEPFYHVKRSWPAVIEMVDIGYKSWYISNTSSNKHEFWDQNLPNSPFSSPIYLIAWLFAHVKIYTAYI